MRELLDPATDCNLHGRNDCTLCDECGHEGSEHLWAPALQLNSPEAAEFVYANPTCWGENVCRLCDEDTHRRTLALAESVPA